MLVTVAANVVCTIEDGFHLLELARREVEATKLPEEWERYYPDSPTGALQLLVRQAIALRLLTCGGVTLHEIGHAANFPDAPLG